MFVQVVVGRAPDAAAVRRQWDRWATDLAPGAVGFVGATGGVTTDRRVVLVARLRSAVDCLPPYRRLNPVRGGGLVGLVESLNRPSSRDANGMK